MSLLSTLRGLVAPEWRTVAIAPRSVRFEGTFYPLHGIDERRAVRVPYSVLLQEDERGRRRVSFECSNEAVSRSQLRADPIMSIARQWTRGGDAVAPFLAFPA